MDILSVVKSGILVALLVTLLRKSGQMSEMSFQSEPQDKMGWNDPLAL